MSRRVIYTGNPQVLDHGQPLWPARDDPSDNELKVWAALETLTKRQREVVEMRHYGDWTFKQIGAKLGISKQAAHATYDRAITRMREMLNATFE